MYYTKAMLIALASIILLLGGLPALTSTTTTTTFVAAMSIANQDLERYFRTANATHTFASMSEERIAMDVYNYAFLNWSYFDGMDIVKSDYKEEQARYGEGKIMSIDGKLVHISNVDDISDDYACTPHIAGTRGIAVPAKGIPWIALVRRGRCTFEDKVKHVYAQNAIGVIIYNDKQVMQLEKMQIKGKNRNITAVITYQRIGIELASLVDKGQDVNIRIIEGRNGMRPISTLNRTSVLFVSISFIVLMIISLVWLIFYYIQRFRYLQAKDQQSRNLCSVTKKAIMKIPTKTGKMTDEKDLDSDCCAICIEAYKPADIIRILPCKHEFHKTCIDPWLIEHRTCPMCKLDVLKFYGYVVGDQIQQTPSPQHIAPANYAHVVSDQQQNIHNHQQQQQHQQPQQQQPQQHLHQQQQHLHASPDVPVLICAVSQRQLLTQQQQQQQQIHTLDTLNINSSNCSNTSCSVSQHTNHQDQQQQQQQNGGRRNSAPATVLSPVSSTASRQFLGSEESILEYEPERGNNQTIVPIAAANTENNTNATAAGTATVASATGNTAAPSALSDLIRSRDFVIDFPRVFVLDSGSVVGARDTLFPARLPERSQSSLSLQNARDWMSQMTNKLEEQHGLQGLRRLRKDEMQQNLLDVRDSMRQRRSHSADGRYTNGFFGRQQLKREMEEQNQVAAAATENAATATALVRHNSNVALHNLTDASYALSRQRQREGNSNNLNFVASTRRRLASRRESDISLRALNQRQTVRRAVVSQTSNDSTASSPPDISIQIQINGEGVNFE